MRQPRDITKPQPGYWMVRYKKHGEVPVAIVWLHTTTEPGEPDNAMERSPHLAGFIDGAPADPFQVWELKGREIDEATYLFEVADRAWLKRHDPDNPKLNPDARKSAPVQPPSAP